MAGILETLVGRRPESPKTAARAKRRHKSRIEDEVRKMEAEQSGRDARRRAEARRLAEESNRGRAR